MGLRRGGGQRRKRPLQLRPEHRRRPHRRGTDRSRRTPVCDEAHRDELRTVEDAWGAQWRFAGPNATLAETLTLDERDRYGLVVVGYWASTPGSAIDRQLVLRMTAPPNWIDDIRRVANGVRGAVKF